MIQTHLNDIQNIQVEHFTETKNQTNPSILSSFEECPYWNDNIFNYRECGTLGVGNGRLNYLGTCSLNTMVNPNKILVWVTKKYNEW